MKKILCLVLALVMVLTTASVFAQDGGGSNDPRDGIASLDPMDTANVDVRKITFDNSIDDGKTDAERGMERVKSVSSISMGKSLSNDQLEKIGRSDTASVVTQYYIEDIEMTKRGEFISEMVNVSESEYNGELSRRPEMNPPGEKFVNTTDSSDTTSTRDIYQGDIDGGLFLLEIVEYSGGSTLADVYYIVDAAFKWDVMPVKRQVDVFGISRGNNTVTYGDFNAYTEVFRHVWQGIVSQAGTLLYDYNASFIVAANLMCPAVAQ